MVRLQKFLAECGICSRRKAEEYIALGFVSINGNQVKEAGTKVDPTKDKVTFRGKPVKVETRKVYILFNKPTGCVTTAKDQFDRKTVLDYIDIPERLVPVGRLDYDTSGLVILTNDGDLTYKLTHPKNNINKRYRARVLGVPTYEKIEKLQKGIAIEDYITAPARVKILKKENKNATLEITIYEGKNRQVRKMCEAIGHRVLGLERVAIEDLTIRDIKQGEYRFLTKKEVDYLKKLAK